MVTKEKIKIYDKYGGDIDSWARMGLKKEKSIMIDDDWRLIDDFIQDINLVERGLTSETFASELMSRLNDKCDNDDTIQALRALSPVAKSRESTIGNKVIMLLRAITKLRFRRY